MNTQPGSARFFVPSRLHEKRSHRMGGFATGMSPPHIYE
jgi:hypothetical protein